MASKRRISPAERRHMDYLRKKGLKVGHLYETRLRKLRGAEVKRLLTLCQDFPRESWEDVISLHLDESYLHKWYKGLYVDAGLPMAKSTARDMSRGKSTPDAGYWEDELIRYAEEQAGEKIVIVQGTLRDELVALTRNIMQENMDLPIEKLTRKIMQDYSHLALWQCRRIAQTETMIGLAGAGDIAARSLDVPFMKQWITSGLGNVRETHEAMDGLTADMDEPFVLPDGDLMMFPHDASLGASAGEIINCACGVLRIPK